MRIKYNAPTTLTFTFISAMVLILSLTLFQGLTGTWFAAPGRGSFNAGDIRCWITLFTHVLGHANLDHFLANFSFILLLGPILEANYGSRALFLMILITALVTGVLNVLFFPTGLLGASGVVFMMILLASFTNFSKGEIPLTFILILALYLGREIIDSFSSDDISQFAHIAGGFCGSLFGFFRPGKRVKLIE
ncbi:MAG: rhomboid family intramembrane serine protease [Treponema sp.]|nr:rhomboid family intramembrane serine protease [Treponema sp.]